MKKYILYIALTLVVLFLIVIGFEKIAGIIGIGGLALQKQREKAKQRIDEAGDSVEKENFDNADDAADYIDDVLDDNSE